MLLVIRYVIPNHLFNTLQIMLISLGRFLAGGLLEDSVSWLLAPSLDRRSRWSGYARDLSSLCGGSGNRHLGATGAWSELHILQGLLQLSDGGILVINTVRRGLGWSNDAIYHVIRALSGKCAWAVRPVSGVFAPSWSRCRHAVVIRLAMTQTTRHCRIKFGWSYQ